MPYFPPGGSSAGGVLVQDEGVAQGTATTLNFAGTGVTSSLVAGVETITVNAGAATAAGLVNSVQYNKAGALSGADHLFVDASGCLAILAMTGAQNPVTPSSGSGTYFTRTRAGRVMPGFLGPSGMDFPLMPHIGMQRVYFVGANAGLTTATIFGMTASFTGAVGAASWANTNFSSSISRLNLTPAGAGTTSAGAYCGNAIWWIGNAAGLGGFYSVMRSCIASGNAVNNTRFFAGWNTGTGAPFTGDPSALFNVLGIGKDAGDTTYQFMHNDGAGTAVKINTGITYTMGDVYEIRIFAKSGMNGASGSLGMSMELLSVGGSGTPGLGTIYAEWINSASTDIPATNAALAWRQYTQTSLSAAGNFPRLGFMSTYVETDN